MNQATMFNPTYGGYPVNGYPAYQSQPQQPASTCNAVKIDIINPQAYGSSPNTYNANPYYSYPNASMYSMPMNPIYAPQAQAMPQQWQVPYSPPMPMAPQQPVQQYPYVPTQIMPPMQPVQPMPQFQPVQQQPAQYNEPANIAQQTVSAIPVPPPVIDIPATPVQQVKTTPQQQDTSAIGQQPALDKALQVDVTNINNGLKSANSKEQTQAIEEIARIMQTEPQKSSALVNEGTINSLVGIMKTDTNAMPGPSAEQLKLREQLFSDKAGKMTPDQKVRAEEISPKEQAELNKQIATLSLAMLQKELLKEVNAQAASQGIARVSISQQFQDGQGFPGINDVVNMAKDDPNPNNRITALSALNYLTQPEADGKVYLAPQDKDVLAEMFDISAKQDADPNVRKMAQIAKEALNGIATQNSQPVKA